MYVIISLTIRKHHIQDTSMGIPEDFMGLDIGLKTINEFKNVLSESNHIIWNGPVGVFELDNFSEGCRQLMNHISNLSATTIIGGGDTLLVVKNLIVQKK